MAFYFIKPFTCAMSIDKRTHIHGHTHTQTQTHTHTHTHIYTDTHTHTHIDDSNGQEFNALYFAKKS